MSRLRSVFVFPPSASNASSGQFAVFHAARNLHVQLACSFAQPFELIGEEGV